jgi:signal peptidase I
MLLPSLYISDKKDCISKMRIRFEEEQKKERRRKIAKNIIFFLAEVAVVILIAWLIIHFAMKRASMIGSSMEPTLYNGEDVMINKTSYALFSPGRNAVIAFYPEQNEGDEVTVSDDSDILIRRVLGLPGETVQIKDGALWINGEEYTEKYDFDTMVSAGKAASEIKLADNEYFVLSDNRLDMDDSRNTSFTVVKRENIIGKVILSLNPLSLIGGPKQTDETEEE